MADYLAMDAATVARHVEALYAAFPELAEDEALRADMVEGETDLHRVVSRALDHRMEARTMVKAMAERRSDLAERSSRWQRREDAMDVLIKGLMDIAGLEKLVLPEATISVNKARASVEITDESELPQGFVKLIRQPDKTAIGDALKAGAEVPGASLAYGEPSLTVRTK
jgi:hypothetical protein